MKSSSDPAPSAYFSAFSRLVERIEITTDLGERVSIDRGIGLVIDQIESLRSRRGKVLLIGNGGSAAIASHMHNDLCKAVGIRAIVFNDLPLLTAVANDHGYHAVFHRPMDLWADSDDVLVAISSSGESENIVKAASLAKEKGCHLVTFTGFKPTNRLRRLGDLNVYVPASDYGYVELTHSVIAHCVTDLTVMRTAATV